jgi:DNA-binding transcriptional MocR family regulator
VVGGYFIWLRLPPGVNAVVLAQRAKDEENLIVAEGGLFEVPGDSGNKGTSFEEEIRLCFTFEEENRLSEGVERLARVVGRMLKGVTSIAGNGQNRKDDQSKFW